MDPAINDPAISGSAARVRLLGCPVDAITMQGTLGWCLDVCRNAERARILLTVNALHLVTMQQDSEFREACVAADLVTADGMSVVWAARLLGRPVPERVTGIELLSRLLELCSEKRLRVFFLGARREVLARLVANCRAKYPNLVLAGWRDGYFAATENEAVISEIRDSKADILFVGMSSPFKDIWCQQHRNSFDIPLIIGVGGSFDILAGVVPRAPAWMQRAGLEWAWRLMLEPRRLWKRYLIVNSRFVWLVLKQLLHHL
jgi:N-acetylglucosaminyldiphosphoundecaprenol N-acetyl-beta-D-mannosaminyltransferase